MKLTCQLGICTIGNVEYLGNGQPVKILILDVGEPLGQDKADLPTWRMSHWQHLGGG